MKPAFVNRLIEMYSDESAVTTVEYALVAALVVVVVLVAVNNLTTAETGAMNSAKTYFEGSP